MGAAIGLVVALIVLIGLAAFIYWKWKQSSAVAQQAQAEASVVDSTEEKIEQEAQALAAQLAKSALARANDSKVTAATDAKLQAQIKAVEGMSDAALDGYLISRSPAKPK